MSFRGFSAARGGWWGIGARHTWRRCGSYFVPARTSPMDGIRGAR